MRIGILAASLCFLAGCGNADSLADRNDQKLTPALDARTSKTFANLTSEEDFNSQFSCSSAGIAAYADQLVTKARKSCTSHGVGVVKEDNYDCMQEPINQLNTPNKDLSFNVISTLLKGNYDYPMLECTYFVQAVTAGVCGEPISPPDTSWQDYPLAHTFVNKRIPGYKWMKKNQGGVQVGDILLYNSSGRDDPGHIMIVAEVIDSKHFRIAEANALNPDGSDAREETGVVSNTRIETLDNRSLAGWQRRVAN